IASEHRVIDRRAGNDLQIDQIEVANLNSNVVRRQRSRSAIESPDELLVELDQAKRGNDSVGYHGLVGTGIHKCGDVSDSLTGDWVSQVEQDGWDRWSTECVPLAEAWRHTRSGPATCGETISTIRGGSSVTNRTRMATGPNAA